MFTKIIAQHRRSAQSGVQAMVQMSEKAKELLANLLGVPVDQLPETINEFPAQNGHASPPSAPRREEHPKSKEAALSGAREETQTEMLKRLLKPQDPIEGPSKRPKHPITAFQWHDPLILKRER